MAGLENHLLPQNMGYFPVDDLSDKDDSKRKSRNLSEKKRRDQFNMLINELTSVVAVNTRKMDKSTVLKNTINFLKTHNDNVLRSRQHEISETWKPPFLSNEEYAHLMLEATDSFIIIFTSCGKLLYTSDNFTTLLGYLPGDIPNLSIYSIVHKDDHTQLCSIFFSSMINENVQKTEGNPLSFQCRCIRKSISYKESCSIELVEFTGYIRKEEIPIYHSPTASEGGANFSTSPNVRLVFVGTARLQTPQLLREVMSLDTSKCEFSSHHNLEWKYIFLDHRAPPIIGYSPFEVLGTSGYDYYHMNDLEKLIAFHEILKEKGRSISGYYRFLTKGQQWIWLQTKCYITYHQWLGKPESIVCTHRVVSFRNIDSNMLQHCGRGSLTGFSSDYYQQKFDRQSGHHYLEDSDATSESSSGCNFGYSEDSSGPRLRLYHPQQQLVSETSCTGNPTTGTVSSHPSGSTALSSLYNSTSMERDSYPAASLESRLQKKHEELQQVIVQRQEELRRVSEQLFMARCGFYTPIAETSSTAVIPSTESSGEEPVQSCYIPLPTNVTPQASMSSSSSQPKEDIQEQTLFPNVLNIHLDDDPTALYNFENDTTELGTYDNLLPNSGNQPPH